MPEFSSNEIQRTQVFDFLSAFFEICRLKVILQVLGRVENTEWENRRIILELLMSEKFSDKFEIFQTPHNDIRLREVQNAKNITWTPVQSSRDTSDNLSQISVGSEW